MSAWRQRLRGWLAKGAAPPPPAVETEPAAAPRRAVLPATPPERLFTAATLRRAWLAVRRADGGPGVDGATIAHFAQHLDEELARLQADLVSGQYRPHPVRQVLVPKPSGGLRPLAMWALRDRIAQRALHEIIAPVYETVFLPCSFGFRPGLGVENAVRQVVAHRDRNLRWVLDADIEKCFDTMDARLLLKILRRRVKDPVVLRYVQRWLEADILNSADGVPRKAGASQGSVLSPLLANIYLHEMDQALTQKGLALVRYADDFVVLCRRKADAEAAQVTTQRALAALHLRLNPHKTHIVHFDQGFAWLGYFFVKQDCYRL